MFFKLIFQELFIVEIKEKFLQGFHPTYKQENCVKSSRFYTVFFCRFIDSCFVFRSLKLCWGKCLCRRFFLNLRQWIPSNQIGMMFFT